MAWSWGDLATWGSLQSWSTTTSGSSWSWGDLASWGVLETWGTIGATPYTPTGPFTIVPFDASTPTLAATTVARATVTTAPRGVATIQRRGAAAPHVEAIPATVPTVAPAAVVPARVTIRALDRATLTAYVTTPPDLTLPGHAVFIGGDVSPEAAGLVADGVPYLWFRADGILEMEDGT